MLIVRSALDYNELGRVPVPGNFDGIFGPDVDFDVDDNIAFIASPRIGVILVDLSPVFSSP